MKKILLFSCVLFSVQAISIDAVQNSALSRELAIKSENNEQDIRMLKERVETQESLIDSISEKVSSYLKNADALQKSYQMKAHGYLPKDKLGEIVPFLEDVLQYDFSTGWKRLLSKLEDFFDKNFDSEWRNKIGY